MAIYLKIPGVTGSVSTQGYKGWVELSSMHFDVERDIHFVPGKATNRTLSATHFSAIEFIKPRDISSNIIMDAISRGKSFDSLLVHCCTTGREITPYEKYELSNAMFHKQTNIDTGHGQPSERILLHYTKINRTYIPRGSSNKPASPQTTGFDLGKQQAS